MKSFIAISSLICMVFSSSLYGSDLSNTDAPSQSEQVNQGSAVTQESEPEENLGTPVSQGSNQSEKEARKKMWINIGIAVVAVAIAVTALVLVSKHHGKKAN